MCMGVLFRCVEVGVVSGAWVMGVLFGSMGVSFGCGGGVVVFRVRCRCVQDSEGAARPQRAYRCRELQCRKAKGRNALCVLLLLLLMCVCGWCCLHHPANR